MAEVNNLKQVVSHRSARFAVAKMTLDIHLLAELKRTIDIVGE
jgi:hypothetical protein